ncbi:MAG: sodium-dependent transporter [Nanoarchaeota archaeon]
MARQRWNSRLIFLFAAIGSAVGLGNVWRFPYLVGKYGGGAFLIPYLLVLFVLGLPLLIAEFALGQKMQAGAVRAFGKIKPKLSGIGLGAIMAGFIVVAYYAVVMSWSVIYLFSSLKIPWASDPKGFFFNDVLQITGGVGDIGGINWMIALGLLVSWIIIYFSIWKGVKSVGKVVMITMPLPIILIFVLVVRGITLPHALDGIIFYLKPNFAALLDFEVWTAAISQIFFTLSLAFGIMIAYASFNKEKSDITKNAVIIAIANSTISIIAGFAVFSTLGFMASQQGATVGELASAGPSLAFIVYPQALSLMPLAWLFSIIFFVTLLSLAIDSAFSLVEGVTTAFSDRFRNISKPKISFWVCLVGFLAGIIFATRAGLYFLDIIDHFITNFGLVLVGIFEAIAIGWIFGADKLRAYINSVSDFKLGKWWEISIRYITPILLIIFIVAQFLIEIQANYEGYPDWAIAIGWGVIIVPIIIAVIFSFRYRLPAKEKA